MSAAPSSPHRKAPRRRIGLAGLLLAASALAAGPGSTSDGAAGPGADGPDCPPPPATVPSTARLQAALRVARDHGLLWRIERPARAGQPPRQGWLYGTVPQGTLASAAPGPQLREVMQAARGLVLERAVGLPGEASALHPTEAALQQAEQAARQAHPWPAALGRRLAQAADAACLDAADRTRPALLQLAALAEARARRAGWDAGWSQAEVLRGHAQAAGLPIQGLDTPEEQVAALWPADAADGPALIADLLDQLDDPTWPAVQRRLMQAWSDGHLDTLADWRQWCGCADTPTTAALWQRRLDARQARWAARIDARLQDDGGPWLVAIDALHLAGPHGLPAQLRQRGWQLHLLTPRRTPSPAAP
ncbi:MAG: hypothetical protein RIQ53_620 [Pseudomonadota bacterium]|jgi:uncharacterized protein YbaP (TraB family)